MRNTETAAVAAPGWVTYPVFEPYPGLVCVSTVKAPPAGADDDEPANMACHVGPGRERAADRRVELCRRLGLDFARLAAAEQIHGNRVAVVGADEEGAGRADRATAIRGADGLATDRAGVALLSLSADCCPLVIFDPVRRAVACVHAGRKGTAGRIAEAAVAALMRAFGSHPADLVAGIGPSIGPCCYQVGPEIRDEFPDRPDLFRQRGGATYLDLWAANRSQLLAAGLRPEAVGATELCTACDTRRFFSYRRQGTGCGLLATVAAVRAG
jgi:YfiH family protein